jgi:hypothetical protein
MTQPLRGKRFKSTSKFFRFARRRRSQPMGLLEIKCWPIAFRGNAAVPGLLMQRSVARRASSPVSSEVIVSAFSWSFTHETCLAVDHLGVCLHRLCRSHPSHHSVRPSHVPIDLKQRDKRGPVQDLRDEPSLANRSRAIPARRLGHFQAGRTRCFLLLGPLSTGRR